MITWGALFEYQEAYAGKAYKLSRQLISSRSLKKEINIVFRNVVTGCILLFITAYFISLFVSQPSYTLWVVPKSLLVFFGIINILLLSFERIALYKITQFLRKNKDVYKRTIILGTGDVAWSIAKWAATEKMHIVGFVDVEDCDSNNNHVDRNNILGSIHDISDVLHSYHIDELIIAIPAACMGKIDNVINQCDKEGIPVRIISPFVKNLLSKSRTEMAYGYPNILMNPADRNDFEMALKRVIDILFSSVGLVILFPLCVLIAIVIKIDSPGPVFYRWKILGLHKRPLVSYKFRTMIQNADEMKAQLLDNNEMKSIAFKMRDDPRITRAGKWLRKYSLDELPQLWSVLKGDLSLVGPRPPLQSEVEAYEGWHRRKLSVKPGLTCLWQVSGRNKIADFDEWIRLDLEYIDEWTLWMDLKILIKTIPAVIKGSGI
jgi:exopolysaccharide biosynthesis polyprenyl glycosylphosphotransferase